METVLNFDYPIPQSYSTSRHWNFKKIESFNLETKLWNGSRNTHDWTWLNGNGNENDYEDE